MIKDYNSYGGGILKFLHLSDLHLGSILNIGNIKESRLESEAKVSIYNSFKKAIDIAIEEKVDFIIISGDIYDRDCYFVKANKIFIEEMNRLMSDNIQVFLIHGNHDPLKVIKNISEMPINVHVFGSKRGEIFKFYGKNEEVCNIIGQSYENREEGNKIYKDYFVNSSAFNIGILHTSLNPGDKSYVPSSIKELCSISSIDYWALGHIHKNGVLNQKPYIVYPGIPQGRDFGETGIKGCYLVNVQGKEVTPRYIPLGEYIFLEIEIDISKNNPTNLTELILIMREKIKKVKELNVGIKGYITRFNIIGRGEINKLLKLDKEEIGRSIEETLNSEFRNGFPLVWTEKVEIRTSEIIKIKEENKLIIGIEEEIKKINEDEYYRKEFLTYLGMVYRESYDVENEDSTKINIETKFLNKILNSAKDLIIEQYLEGEEYEI